MRFGQDGQATVLPRAGDGGEMRLGLAGVGRSGATLGRMAESMALGACVADGAVDEMGTCLKRLEVKRNGVVEWWESREDGLEQGFVIENRPEGKGLLELNVAIDGAQVEVAGDHATEATLRVDERTAWSYAGLHVEDARGKALESWMERDDVGGVRIVVEDEGAVYPVVVDPVLSPVAVWTAEADQNGAEFGTSVASAGDVNGDGYGDVIVGAPYYDIGQMDEGRAYVYLGSANGLASLPAWTAGSNQPNAEFGFSVGSAGDVNGDGYGDVIVGAPKYDNGQIDEGRAYVYLGNALGLGTSAAWTAESNQVGAQFGWSVASAGDVDGDTYSDVIVGAPDFDDGLIRGGRVFVYLGVAAGLQTNAAWTAESNQVGADFGNSVATAGDVNGDGYGDVIVGAPMYDNGSTDEGRAYVYQGGASGLAALPAWIAESDQPEAQFGNSVASAGDVNGDGYGDVIVGAPYYDKGEPDEGRAFVYLGSVAGIGTMAAWTAESDQVGAHFGNSVASAADVNGDGFGDVIVGAYKYDNGQMDEGRVYVFTGGPNGLAGTAAWTRDSNQNSAYLGQSAASAGDVNGDGFSDVIVGAPSYDSGQVNEGRAYVYLGSGAGPGTAATWTTESNQSAARYGWSVASAGDVNGDGFGDVIVGAPFYNAGQGYDGRAYVYLGSAGGLAPTPGWAVSPNEYGAQFGWSVASAGDVNGDGYGDVIVGAPYHDQDPNNGTQENEGAVYVYLGSAMGLANTATWSTESVHAGALFGLSVASAGDVNGDGYGDVIVGAPFYSSAGLTERGYVHVYLGSATGLLNPTTNPPWLMEGDQSNAQLGAAVASAGDVNGDGFGDVIIGAATYDDVAGRVNTGRVYVYMGSALGLETTAAWTAEGDQEFAVFGWSVASAGDVNGDGFSDVIIGARTYDNGQLYPDAGRAYVYLGSTAGLASIAAWTAGSTQEDGYFGHSVASAGDVNGDGFGDVIIGAPGYGNGQTDEGHAYVYFGSASGLGTNADWTVTSDKANALFGFSVAGAGDVNGDGFGDVIVGAYRYGNGEPNEGRAVVYATSGAGRPHLRLFDSVANRPLMPWSALIGSVRVKARGSTPFGRLNVKPEVEVKPLGEAFNGLQTTLSPSWTPGFSSGAFQEFITDVLLSQAKPHHLRWRLRYHPAEGQPALASRWIYAAPSGDARGVHFRFGVCGNGVVDGDEACDDGNVVAGDDCSIACKWELGQPCTSNAANACESGFCVDGVCCDGACDGFCRACTKGRCENFADDTDPEDECTEVDQSTCREDGKCDGNGACRLRKAETLCGSICAGNVLKLATCDGFGTCRLDPIGTDCGVNGCDPITGQCITACITDANCTADAYCDTSTGQCKPKTTLGTGCTASEQCQSGHCVDDVCCNEACDGLCRACNADGICTAVATDPACAPDPMNPCGFTGECTDVGTCAFAMNGKECAPSSCKDDIAQSSSCNGNGTCVATPTSCGNYACDATTCKTTCTSNLDCIESAHCDNGQCKPDTSVKCPSDCKGPCETGVCTAAGTCELKPAGQSCGDAGLVCNDKGDCVIKSATGDCSPYQHADSNLCKTACTSDTDCLGGYECRNKECGTQTCDEMKKCLEREMCDPHTHTCTPAATAPSSCTCQTPGSRSADPHGTITSLALALLMLRRAQSRRVS